MTTAPARPANNRIAPPSALRRHGSQLGIIGVGLAMWLGFVFAAPAVFTNIDIYRAFAQTTPQFGIIALSLTFVVITGGLDPSEVRRAVSAGADAFVVKNASKAELVEATSRLRVPCAPVRELEEVVNDPHMHARGALQHVDHPDLGDVVLTAGPLRYGDSTPREIVPSRGIGADNTSVYHDLLGLSEAEIAALAAGGAI